MEIITAILVLLLVYLIWYTKFRKSDLPPGPLKLPFIGNLWWFIFQKMRKVRIPTEICKIAKKYGDVIHFQVGQENIVFLHGFDAIKEAFITQADVFSSRPTRAPDQEKGVVMENGERHRKMRCFIMKFLNSDTARLEEKILEEVDAAVDYLNTDTDNVIEMKPQFTMIAMNFIHNIMLNKRLDYSDETLHKLMNNFATIFKSGSAVDATAILPKFIKKHLKSDQKTEEARQWLTDYISEEVTNHEISYDENNLRDFVDVYIKERKKDDDGDDLYTLERLFQVIKDMFAAGSEASAVALTSVILYMQEYPEVQVKCQREIREKCGDRTIRLSDSETLSYLESTMLEILRMASTAETSLPHMTEKETKLCGYRIPKGSIVLANLQSSNKDRKYWKEPDLFIPKRFLQDEGMKNPAFHPFGLGPRRCLGYIQANQEIFLIIANLLQRFTFQREDPNVKHTFECMHDQLTATPLPFKTKIIKRQ